MSSASLRLPSLQSTPTLAGEAGSLTITGLHTKEPQIPPVLQDKDECEPMFIQPHDPDYVLEPIYPEYIPLEDEYEFPAEEQPLPLVVSPTTESPGYVVESDPEEDPKEEQSSVYTTPSTDITTTGVRITVRLQASISLPPEAEALVDAVNAHYHHSTSQPLPPSLYMPPHVDHRDDILESERPPRKRSCLFALGSRYEVGESSTTRPTRGRRVDYRFFITLDTKERRRGIREVGYGIREILGWVQQRPVLEDSTYDRGEEVLTRVTSLLELYEGMIHRIVCSTKSTVLYLDISTGNMRSLLLQQAGEAEPSRDDRRRQAHMVETLRVMRDMRQEMGYMQAKLLALREQQRRARQPAPDARVPDHQDAS
ncbi:hypothetical protein Tco_0972075 [Tanacetum coccineum]